MLRREGLKAFKFKNTTYYFKSYKVQAIYEFLFLLFGVIEFYFIYIVLYAIMYDLK